MAGAAWPLAGGTRAFTAIAVLWRDDGDHWVAVASFSEVVEWAEIEGGEIARHVSALIHRIGKRRKSWAGLDMALPQIMGIVNATPDSFSDGGDNFDPAKAIASGLAMVEAGAVMVDVGGESTRPGAEDVAPEQELARVLPVVRALAERGVCVSIDTRRPIVMAQAIEAGARIINDVAALREPGALEFAASSNAALCLMHMLGEPRHMQDDPHYQCAPLEVYDFLAERLAAAEAAGIDRDRIALDPGIGFGKSVHHNTQILGALSLYHGLGCPLLLGASRKRFIAALSAGEDPKQRLPGSLVAALTGCDAGVGIIRVHDVAETVQAIKVWQAIG